MVLVVAIAVFEGTQMLLCWTACQLCAGWLASINALHLGFLLSRDVCRCRCMLCTLSNAIRTSLLVGWRNWQSSCRRRQHQLILVCTRQLCCQPLRKTQKRISSHDTKEAQQQDHKPQHQQMLIVSHTFRCACKTSLVW